MKRTILSLFLAAAVLFFSASCDNASESVSNIEYAKLIGKWTPDKGEYTLVFNEDDVDVVTDTSVTTFTISIKEDVLTLGGSEDSYLYSAFFGDGESKLTLTQKSGKSVFPDARKSITFTRSGNNGAV